MAKTRTTPELETITEHLRSYRSRIVGSFGQLETRAALALLLRCFDYDAFLAQLSHKTKGGQEENIREGWNSLIQENCWGLFEALGLFWTDRVALKGIPVFVINPTDLEWGESVLQACSRIRRISHLMELERLGLVEIKAAGVDVFECHYICSNVGIERAERDDFSFLASCYAQRVEEHAPLTNIRAEAPGIFEVMRELVRPWAEYYIQYDADPEVDAYYKKLANVTAPSRLGWDAFPLNARFGGVTFSRYLECVGLIMSFAFKHQDFCALLSEKYPHINPVNTLTVPSEIQKTTNYISHGIGCDQREAAQVLAATNHRTRKRGPSFHHAGWSSCFSLFNWSGTRYEAPVRLHAQPVFLFTSRTTTTVSLRLGSCFGRS